MGERAGTKSRSVRLCDCVCEMDGGGLKKLTAHPACLSHFASQLSSFFPLLCASTGSPQARRGVIMQRDRQETHTQPHTHILQMLEGSYCKEGVHDFLLGWCFGFV